MSRFLIADFDSAEKARLGLEILAKAGYGEQHVSFVARSDAPELQQIAKLGEKHSSPTGIWSGAGLGGLLGGALTAPIAVSTLLGPFLLVGPLVGAGVGAMIGSLLGGAKEHGSHADSGYGYAESVQNGGVLVIVTGDDAELHEATASIKTAGPRSVHRFTHSTPETQS